jgi:hypothetical protein
MDEAREHHRMLNTVYKMDKLDETYYVMQKGLFSMSKLSNGANPCCKYAESLYESNLYGAIWFILLYRFNSVVSPQPAAHSPQPTYLRRAGVLHYRGPCSICSGVELCRTMQGGQVAMGALWDTTSSYKALYVHCEKFARRNSRGRTPTFRVNVRHTECTPNRVLNISVRKLWMVSVYPAHGISLLVSG